MTASPSAPRERNRDFATATGLLVGASAYFLTLFNYRTDALRTASPAGWFSNFYDLQARAFMAGRLDVPEGSLGIEGFVVDGKTYTYFGPFPALLRIPVFLVSDTMDGRLSLLSMALAWLVFAGFVCGLVWTVRRFFVGEAPVGRWEAVFAAIFIAAATGGTTLTYDAALPWVYHEAYIWASATAVAGLYWLARTIEVPSRRNATGLGLSALAAVLSRIPAGWAVSGAALLLALWLATPHRRRRHGQLWPVFFTAGALPLLVGVAYNMRRFHHPWLFPLQNQVWTEVNEQRRRALEANGGTLTGLQFIPTTVINYFRPDGIRFVDHFPWITLPAEPARAYAGAFLDQTYRTGSASAFMPLLFALCIVAVATLLRFRRNRHLRPLFFVFLGGVAVSAGIIAYGYLSNRYVSDLVPGLVAGGTIGLWALVGATANARSAVKGVTVAVVAVGAAFGIAANMATGLDTASQLAGDKALRTHLSRQLDTSSAASVRARVQTGTSAPQGGRTDDLFVQGPCDALYLNTGDHYQPWLLVEHRHWTATLVLDDRLRAGSMELARLEGNTSRRLVLETQSPRSVRIVLIDDGIRFPGPWIEPYPGEPVRLGAAVRTGTGYLEVSSTPGGRVGFLPFVEWDDAWQSSFATFTWTHAPDQAARLGVQVIPSEGRAPALCERVRRVAE